MNEKQLGQFRGRRILVIGSGVGYGAGPPIPPLPDEWEFRAVRGPLSLDALGLSQNTPIIDPAMMLPKIFNYKNIPKNDRPVFVPHHSTIDRHDWEYFCNKVGIEYISPVQDAKEVIKKIASAPLVLAEAMHAAIIADAFRVPWVPVRIGPRFNAFKWQDWAGGMELSFDIPYLFPWLEKMFKVIGISKGVRFQEAIRIKLERFFVVNSLRHSLGRQPILSSNKILRERQKYYQDILDSVSADFGS